MTVSKQLIQNIEELRKSLNEISVYDLDVYTSMELYYKIANKLNEVINELSRFEGVVSDEVIKQNKELLYLLDEGLNLEVVKKINNMINDGTMEVIINNNLFKSFNNSLEKFESDLEVERKRIDSLSKLNDGSTTGDAELIDGRISYNGIVYSNIGSAIRTSNENLQMKLNKLNEGKDLKYGYDLSLNWVLGTVNWDGTLQTSNNRYRFNERLYLEKDTTIEVKNGFRFFVCGYASEESEGLITYTDWKTSYTTDKDMYVIIVFATNDSSLVETSSINDKITFTRDSVLKSNLIEDEKLPDYYSSYLNNKINLIRNKLSLNPKNKIAFYHISDQHYPNNSHMSKLIMEEINKKCNINLCFNTGDYINEQIQNKNKAIDLMLKANELQYVNDKYFSVVGNHDDNANYTHTNSNRKLSNAITNGEYYNYLFKNIKDVEVGETGKYYYYDDKLKKIRFICLDCFDNDSYEPIENTEYIKPKPYEISVNQINWLINKALKVADDYSVVVFSHIPLTTTEHMQDSMKNWDLVRNILKGFKEKSQGGWVSDNVDCNFDFRNNSSDLIGCFAGHVHLDIIKKENNITHNIILNDSCVNDLEGQPLRKLGSVNETAFDVVIIDTLSKKVELIRVGAGIDRYFNY